MLYLLRDFSAIAILWTECPHMNGAVLIGQVKPRLLKLTVLQS